MRTGRLELESQKIAQADKIIKYLETKEQEILG